MLANRGKICLLGGVHGRGILGETKRLACLFLRDIEQAGRLLYEKFTGSERHATGLQSSRSVQHRGIQTFDQLSTASHHWSSLRTTRLQNLSSNFVLADGTPTYSPTGSLTQTIPIMLLPDTLNEAGETIQVGLSSPSGTLTFTSRQTGKPLSLAIINSTLRGGFGYFQHAYRTTFPELERWFEAACGTSSASCYLFVLFGLGSYCSVREVIALPFLCGSSNRTQSVVPAPFVAPKNNDIFSLNS
jgi:hypothetical protein